MDNCASYSPHATHTLLPPFSQCISLRCSVRSNLCTSLLPVTYHVCLRGSSRTENARARTDTFTIVFSQNWSDDRWKACLVAGGVQYCSDNSGQFFISELFRDTLEAI